MVEPLDAPAPTPPVRQFRLEVGPANHPAEAEADTIADRVIGLITATEAAAVPGASSTRVRRSASAVTPSVGAEGGPLDSALESRIRASSGVPISSDVRRPFEGAFGADFSRVRVHPDSRSAPALGAEAFTQGSDIHFAPGRYEPGTSEGDHLLAHELAHVVQQDGVRRRVSGDVVVIRRALAGTYVAMVATEGEKGFRAFKTHGSWTDALQALQKYEVMEAKPPVMGSIKKQVAEVKAFQKQLASIAKHCRSWLDAHESDIVGKITATQMSTGDISTQPDEVKQGVEKLSVIRNLLRKVVWEQSQISMNNRRTTARDDSGLQGPAVDNAVGGQASQLDRVTYNAAGPNNPTGFYQPDAVTQDVSASAAGAIGIPAIDPNWAGRSMAAARIDQLLTARLLAAGADAAIQEPSLVQMNFASHSRTPLGANAAVPTTGVYLEKAKGEELRGEYLDDAANKVTATEAGRANAGQLALDDPVLQRAMNKLQLLDALCGQVDRHGGNMYVKLDAQGKVTGVQGIDNDMAFGSKMGGDAEGLRAPQSGVAVDFNNEQRAWKGLPPIADKAVANVILAISAQDIHDAIDGLVSPAEVTATIGRLAATKTFLGLLPANALIDPNDWDAHKTALSRKQQGFNSYLGAARTETQGVATVSAMTVKTQLVAEMAVQNDAPAISKRNGAVPEFLFAEKPIYSDVLNWIGQGVVEATAVTQAKTLARQYAQRVVWTQIDRTGMTFMEALNSVDGQQCARALEMARRMVYALYP